MEFIKKNSFIIIVLVALIVIYFVFFKDKSKESSNYTTGLSNCCRNSCRTIGTGACDENCCKRASAA
jgi:hypothetical protein